MYKCNMDKRMRTKPNKKWAAWEVQKILDYLIEEKDFERPTSQLYYRKFLHQSNISADWVIVRGKVRYLKKSYFDVKEWKQSIDAGLLESAAGTSELKKRILRMCPNYVKLHKIFGKQLADDDDDLCFETADVPKKEDYSDFIESSQDQEYVSVEDIPFEDQSSNDQTSDTESSNPLRVPVTSTTKRKSIEQSSPTTSPTTNTKKIKSSHSTPPTHNESDSTKDSAMSRLEFEQWRIKQELEIRKEELAIKREELNLKKLQIEKDERIAMYEIKMKYKYIEKK